MNSLLRGLTRHDAATDPGAEDRRLRGRTYAIPFEAVWSASLSIATTETRGWTVIRASDEAGTIDIEGRTTVLRIVDDVRITVGLDENAQTRVDVRASARAGRPDLGRNARRIGAFLKKLDRKLDPAPGLILDPTASADWTRGI